MAALGPSRYNDPAQVRPRITASNLGDGEGNPKSEDARKFLDKALGQNFIFSDLTDKEREMLVAIAANAARAGVRV